LVNSTLAHQDIVTSIKVSPSESKIISTSLDNTIKVWKVNGSDIRNLTTVLLDSTVESMNFFQSEKYFYAITKSNNFFLWNINGASQSKMRLQPPIIVNNYKSNQIERDDGKIIIIQDKEHILTINPTLELNYDNEGIIIGKNEYKDSTHIIIFT